MLGGRRDTGGEYGSVYRELPRAGARAARPFCAPIDWTTGRGWFAGGPTGARYFVGVQIWPEMARSAMHSEEEEEIGREGEGEEREGGKKIKEKERERKF